MTEQTTDLVTGVSRDEHLLRRYARGGSEEAFAEIVRRFMPLVYGVSLRELHSRELAQDAAQIVFLVLARKAGEIRDGRALASWLFRTTRTTAREIAVRERRRRAREQQWMDEAKTEKLETDIWDSALWNRVEPALNDALCALRRADQECVLLHYFQGWTLREVGAIFGISEEAARKRVSRAVEKMRRFLERKGSRIAPDALAGLLAGYRTHGLPAPPARAMSAPQFTLQPQMRLNEQAKRVLHKMKIAKIGTIGAAGSAVGLLLGILWLVGTARLTASPHGRIPAAGQPGAAASTARARPLKNDPPPARLQPLQLKQPFTIVYTAAVQWDNKVHMVSEKLRLTLSYDGRNLLYTSENLESHVTRICLYNGLETYVMDSDSGISAIYPGFDFERLLYCPLPGVGIPKMPFFTIGIRANVLPKFVQMTASNVHSEPRYVDGALYRTPGHVRDYGIYVTVDKDARDFARRYHELSVGLGSVVSVPSSGVPRVLWYDTFNLPGKPYLGQIWEYYSHERFQGLWLAKRMSMRFYGGMRLPPRTLIAAKYDLQSAISRPLESYAYEPTTYLLQHANITDFVGPYADTFLYEPNNGPFEIQRHTNTHRVNEPNGRESK